MEGKAYTLLTPRDIQFAGLLVRNMEGANQYVSSQVLALANQVRLIMTLVVALMMYRTHASKRIDYELVQILVLPLPLDADAVSVFEDAVVGLAAGIIALARKFGLDLAWEDVRDVLNALVTR